MRRIIIVSVMSMMALAYAAPGDTSTVNEKVDQTTSASAKYEEGTAPVLELTLAELAKFDGADGKPAYVAVDGVIYDMSKVKAWKKGRHHGNIAGKDLTEVIKKKSPHGLKVLKKLPVAGKLKAE
jgi:predicted heme/steroid binding protein